MQQLLELAFGPHSKFFAYAPFGDWRMWIGLTLAVLWTTAMHEVGHAWMADRLGDPGPRAAGRLSLNPLRHLDPLGTLVMCVTMAVGLPLGWGKSVEVDSTKLRPGPRIGSALVAVAGPLANLAHAAVLAFPVRWFLEGGGGDAGPVLGYVALFLVATIGIAVSQFAFNLVPVHPMDGAHVVAALLPPRIGDAYVAF
ncbi:MAG: site-2 protease family protein, partial [Armatimonadota bacterium]